MTEFFEEGRKIRNQERSYESEFIFPLDNNEENEG